MLIEHRITVPTPPERVWAFMMDIPAVSHCVPGVNGAVNAKMRMQLSSVDGSDKTNVEIRTEANVMGKLGECGQAVIGKKADQIVQEFANNLSAAVAASP